MSSWNQGLNPEQVHAVQHNYGPMLILAGAGSGKTTVLVARTGRLIDENISRAENILVLTFTNKAARELKHRVSARLGAMAKGLCAGTFHSFGMKILREFSQQAGLPQHFGVIDQSDSQAILREIIKDVKIAGKDKFDLQEILQIINSARILGKQKQEAFSEYHEMAQLLLPKYLKKLEILGVVDFEGLLLKPIELLRNSSEVLAQLQDRFQQVMVDEFQDTNSTQMNLIDLLVRVHQNITVVGDDDQSIYGWRGAEVKNILNFPHVYKACEVIRLERNYRSSPNILSVANELIAKNKHRHGKVLKAEGAKSLGEKPELFVLDNEEEEMDFVRREIQSFLTNTSGHFQAKDIAVLYRSNSQGGMLEGILREHHIPYTVSGGTAFFDRKEIKDILAYLRFSINPNDVSLRRILNTPPRGIGDTTVEKIAEYAKQRHLLFYKACREWQKIGVQDKAGESIQALLELCQKLPEKIMQGQQAGANLLQILKEIGYRQYLDHSSSSTEVSHKKWQLIEIFSRVLDSFVQRGGMTQKTLREFIDTMELRDEQYDERQDENAQNKVSLMTLHASKGLEFPFVMLLGVEEDLLPHRTLGGDVDEERRLFYVGITRAKTKLVLTRCRQRKRNGSLRPVSISRFLLEIPPEQMRIYENGFRPVSSDERQSLVSSFLKSLEKSKAN